MRIAFIGTRGVPAQYGGFETAVEEIGARLAGRGHGVRVYARNPGQTIKMHRGMEVVNLPALRKKSLETLSHTAVSVAHAMLRPVDVALVFNAANAPLVPLLRLGNIPSAIHVDGLEYQRAKWGRVGRRYYLLSERLAVHAGRALIADARGIAEHYKVRYGVESTVLPYGMPPSRPPDVGRLNELGLDPAGYHLVVARFEPENHVLEAVEGLADAALPLVVVGAAPYADKYSAKIAAAAEKGTVRLLGRVDDQQLLDALYAGAGSYVHGHSVGGTNPSLLRALAAGRPIMAHDNVFNREVLADAGLYWSTPEELRSGAGGCDLADAAARVQGRRDKVAALYDWDHVADGYLELCEALLRMRRR